MPVPDALEQRIARLLWAWARDPERILDKEQNVTETLAAMLEWFLCNAFKYSPEPSQRCWWSDGVIDLRIEQNSDTVFRTFGATWWAGRDVNQQWVGPFEIEFFFAAKDSLEFVRTIVRFGWKDSDGDIVRSCSCLHPQLQKDRHVRDTDWAMAIELTPPERT